MKTIYHYTESGLYCGQDIADESPLEPGVYLIPALATDIEPPTVTTGKQAVFKNGTWVLEDIPKPVYCYYNNGLSSKIVDSTYVAQTGEVLFSETPTTEQLTTAFSGYVAAVSSQEKTTNNFSLLTQIAELESQGHRASRTITIALASGKTPDATDLTKLQSVETQIAALRAKLQD